MFNVFSDDLAREIDRFVCEHYELADDEIAIVENRASQWATDLRRLATKLGESARMPEIEPLIFHQRLATKEDLGAKTLWPLILEKGK